MQIILRSLKMKVSILLYCIVFIQPNTITKNDNTRLCTHQLKCLTKKMKKVLFLFSILRISALHLTCLRENVLKVLTLMQLKIGWVKFSLILPKFFLGFKKNHSLVPDLAMTHVLNVALCQYKQS